MNLNLSTLKNSNPSLPLNPALVLSTEVEELEAKIAPDGGETVLPI